MKYRDIKDFRKTFNGGNMEHLHRGRKYGVCYIKKYAENEYKLYQMYSVKEKHIEKYADDGFQEYEKAINIIEKMFDGEKADNYQRYDESVSRTKRIIYEYARCNKWDYFVTLTLDENKIDRNDIKNFRVKFNRMISDMNAQITGEEWGRQKQIKYCIVPEFHKKGGVHFHGFIKGLHKSDIRLNKNGFKEWRQYADNFGFMNMQEIRNPKACSKYMTKYITKGLAMTVKGKGEHMYYCSQGLNKAELIYSGYGEYKGEFDYISDYCNIAELETWQLQNFVYCQEDLTDTVWGYGKEKEENKIEKEIRVYIQKHGSLGHGNNNCDDTDES